MCVFSKLMICQNQWKSKLISEEPIIETKQLFFDERMPIIVVTTDGSIITSFGKTKLMFRRGEVGGKKWPIKKSIDQGKFKYSSLAIGKENTPSEGFIYLLREFGDFQNNYAGAKIAKLNLSWLLHGKDIDQYLK